MSLGKTRDPPACIRNNSIDERTSDPSTLHDDGDTFRIAFSDAMPSVLRAERPGHGNSISRFRYLATGVRMTCGQALAN